MALIGIINGRSSSVCLPEKAHKFWIVWSDIMSGILLSECSSRSDIYKFYFLTMNLLQYWFVYNFCSENSMWYQIPMWITQVGSGSGRIFVWHVLKSSMTLSWHLLEWIENDSLNINWTRLFSHYVNHVWFETKNPSILSVNRQSIRPHNSSWNRSINFTTQCHGSWDGRDKNKQQLILVEPFRMWLICMWNRLSLKDSPQFLGSNSTFFPYSIHIPFNSFVMFFFPMNGRFRHRWQQKIEWILPKFRGFSNFKRLISLEFILQHAIGTKHRSKP